MADDSLDSLVGNLRIDSASPPGVQDGITNYELRQLFDTLITNIEQFSALRDTGSRPSLQFSAANSARRSAERLADALSTLRTQAHDFNIREVLGIARAAGADQKLLAHFKEEIATIVSLAVEEGKDNELIFQDVMQKCYNEATTRGGRLNTESYYDMIDEAALGSAYDMDFESEQYYEHENRLNVDESYAEACRNNQARISERRRASRRESQQNWCRVWFDLLHRCLDGPTLFWPFPSKKTAELDIPLPSRFLARAWDRFSSGNNSEAAIESTASPTDPHGPGRRDIMTQTDSKSDYVSSILCAHLTKYLTSAPDSDVFMSWSSSLLFVIQYAIYRYQNYGLKRGLSEDDVYITVVDTILFPIGQFARDLWLIRRCKKAEQPHDRLLELEKLRTLGGFDNGEYLSQGSVSVSGRSKTVSLHQLMQGGLLDCCPEFGDPAGREEWTKRVAALRSQWSTSMTTSNLEIERALNIARTCFQGFSGTCEMALLVLCLKSGRVFERERNTAERTTAPEWRRHNDGTTDYENTQPPEVQKYSQALEDLSTRRSGVTAHDELATSSGYWKQKLRDYFASQH